MNIQNSKYAKTAVELSKQGYNCAQSVLLSCDKINCNREMLAKLASSMGGGFGIGEICGAFSGMSLAIGALYGYSKPESVEEKKKHYAVIEKLSEEFISKAGSIKCSELLDGNKVFNISEEAKPYYNGKPCLYIVAYAAARLEKYIEENS